MKNFLSIISVLAITISLFSRPAHAKDITMAFGLSLPPYVISSNNTGFELEIIREALSLKGHNLIPRYVPLGRVPEMFKDKSVDAAERGNNDIIDGKNGFYSPIAPVEYRDVAVTLKSNNLKIDSIADLEGKSILAFQDSILYLGDDFAGEMKRNPNYKETSDQKSQPAMIYTNRIQVSVGDINIFKYYISQVAKYVDTTQAVVYHDIFNSKHLLINHPVFANEQIRDDFLSGLKILQASGRDKEIIAKYINPE